MARSARTTPMMQQYRQLKAQAGDALMFFRMGDFYELFGEDAVEAAPLLDVVLTTRDKNTPNATPMCGVPYHAAEGYIRKLLAHGRSVAVAEQTEDPKQAKGLVRREIVEIVTPGLVANAERLEGAHANYSAAVVRDGERFGLAYVDISTGELAASELPGEEVLRAELDRIDAREIVCRDADKLELPAGPLRVSAPDVDFDPAGVADRVGHLPDNLGAGDLDPASRAVAALWTRVATLQPTALENVGALRRYRASEGLLLDASTRRHLELFRNAQDGGRRGTLIELLDHTRTPLGRRRLAQWLGEPLADPQRIRARQDAVEAWLEPDSRRRALADALRGVGDLERLQTRAMLPAGGPRDLAALRDALAAVARVAEIEAIADVCADLHAELAAALVDEPPPAPRGEPYIGYVRDGVDEELDRIRSNSAAGNAYFARLEAEERERTGIPTLKVKYNRVFGYSIEVTRTHLAKVPEHYRRKQTTANAERFVTDELERQEGAVLRARETAAAAEARVLERLRMAVRTRGERLRALAGAIAEIDALQSLAEVARARDWIRPELDERPELDIVAGRHPVVEDTVLDGFVPNDVSLDADGRCQIVLTGPNMAGKSTLLRQVGLIVLLAQMGSWVPAQRARIGVADRIFTRVGASDSLLTGESTFMVEMRETAAILADATHRSLVLLDEIGRGTSTFDGLSIAWAVAEHLHDAPGLRPRVLFATHYHELADLARTKSGVENFHFTAAERGGEILFLRRMEPGAASRSYGIDVARWAGLPPEVIRRAREILANLEGGEFDERGRPRLARGAGDGQPAQLALFETARDPLREALRALDPEGMTPVQALVELDRLRRLAEEGG